MIGWWVCGDLPCLLVGLAATFLASNMPLHGAKQSYLAVKEEGRLLGKEL